MANLNAAVAGMAADRATIAKTAQSFANHQQAFSDEIILAANYSVGQMQQQMQQLLNNQQQKQQQLGQMLQQQQQMQQQLGQMQQQLTTIQADVRELRDLSSAR